MWVVGTEIVALCSAAIAVVDVDCVEVVEVVEVVEDVAVLDGVGGPNSALVGIVSCCGAANWTSLVAGVALGKHLLVLFVFRIDFSGKGILVPFVGADETFVAVSVVAAGTPTEVVVGNEVLVYLGTYIECVLTDVSVVVVIVSLWTSTSKPSKDCGSCRLLVCRGNVLHTSVADLVVSEVVVVGV